MPTPAWEISFSSEYHYIRDGVQRFVPLDLPDPFRVAFNFDGRTDIDGNIEALRITGTFDWVRVTLITSWRQWELEPYTADFDYSPVPIVVAQFDLHQTQMAAELRLESIEAQRDWHWLVGLFADRVTNDGSEAFAIDPILKVISFDEGETELAAFGQATRYFRNGFDVTFGMRVDYDEDRITRERTVTFSPTTQFTSNRSEWNVQPKLVVAYEFAPESRVYLTSAYSYRNGGFSFLETDPRLASYQPERVWANETGARLDWFDQRLERLCLRGGASHSDSGDYDLPDAEHTHDHPTRQLE